MTVYRVEALIAPVVAIVEAKDEDEAIEKAHEWFVEREASDAFLAATQEVREL